MSPEMHLPRPESGTETDSSFPPNFDPPTPKSWHLLKAQLFSTGLTCLFFSSSRLIIHSFHPLQVPFKYESAEHKHPALGRIITLLYFAQSQQLSYHSSLRGGVLSKD